MIQPTPSSIPIPNDTSCRDSTSPSKQSSPSHTTAQSAQLELSHLSTEFLSAMRHIRTSLPSAQLTGFHNTISESDARFDTLLSTITALNPGLKKDGVAQVLNIGCGVMRELGSLNRFFSANPEGGSRVKLIGIDTDSHSILQLENKLSFYELDPDALKISVETHKQDARALPTQFHGSDIVIIRHQQAIADAGCWKSIFESSAQALKCGGQLLITSLTEVEHQIALLLFTGLPLTRICSLQHPNPRIFKKSTAESGEQAEDGWIALFERTPP